MATSSGAIESGRGPRWENGLMGYIAHHAVIITISDYVMDDDYKNRDRSAGSVHANDPQMPDLDAFRESLPRHWRPLLVGPIPSATAGYCTVFFAPDGSKEGWRTSDDGDRIRSELIALFGASYDDGSSPFDVVEVRFGGDDPSELTIDDPFLAVRP